MSTHAPYSRNVPMWTKPTGAARTPTPSPAAAGAAPLLLRLLDALDGAEPPCAAAPEVWQPEGRADAGPAVAGCMRCPVQAECGAYADALQPSCGVWAGIYRTTWTAQQQQATNDQREKAAS